MGEKMMRDYISDCDVIECSDDFSLIVYLNNCINNVYKIERCK